MVQKRADIKAGSSVTWWTQIHPDLEYRAGIDAKVTQTDGDTASIAVMKSRVIGAPVIEYQVPLADLENKTWERDPDASALYEQKRRAKATVINEAEWEGSFSEPDGDRVFASVNEYLEHCEDAEIEPSEYLYCEEHGNIPRKCSDDFAEDIFELYEDEPELNGLDELQRAIDAFYEANSHLHVYKTDYSKVVLTGSSIGGAE